MHSRRNNYSYQEFSQKYPQLLIICQSFGTPLFMGYSGAKISTILVSQGREPGPAYFELGICAWSNMTREPTCRINGWSARLESRIAFSSCGCISWVEGIVVAANGSADCARAGDWIKTNVITATLPIVAIDLILMWGSEASILRKSRPDNLILGELLERDVCSTSLILMD